MIKLQRELPVTTRTVFWLNPKLLTVPSEPRTIILYKEVIVKQPMDLTKLIPTIVAVLVMVATALSTSVQGWVSGHPAVAAILAGIYAILSHFLPSPMAAKADSPPADKF